MQEPGRHGAKAWGSMQCGAGHTQVSIVHVECMRAWVQACALQCRRQGMHRAWDDAMRRAKVGGRVSCSTVQHPIAAMHVA